jgi:hypothetical protein
MIQNRLSEFWLVSPQTAPNVRSEQLCVDPQTSLTSESSRTNGSTGNFTAHSSPTGVPLVLTERGF